MSIPENMGKSRKISRNFVKSHEILWNLMKSREISWNLVKSREISWNLVKSREISWDLGKSWKSPKWSWKTSNNSQVSRKTWKKLTSKFERISWNFGILDMESFWMISTIGNCLKSYRSWFRYLDWLAVGMNKEEDLNASNRNIQSNLTLPSLTQYLWWWHERIDRMWFL